MVSATKLTKEVIITTHDMDMSVIAKLIMKSWSAVPEVVVCKSQRR